MVGGSLHDIVLRIQEVVGGLGVQTRHCLEDTGEGLLPEKTLFRGYRRRMGARQDIVRFWPGFNILAQVSRQ